VFASHALQTPFDIFSLGCTLLESLVFTLWIIILQLLTPNIAALAAHLITRWAKPAILVNITHAKGVPPLSG
jgi:hypothetical protein